jgi:hypothetical protein
VRRGKPAPFQTAIGGWFERRVTSPANPRRGLTAAPGPPSDAPERLTPEQRRIMEASMQLRQNAAR